MILNQSTLPGRSLIFTNPLGCCGKCAIENTHEKKEESRKEQEMENLKERKATRDILYKLLIFFHSTEATVI